MPGPFHQLGAVRGGGTVNQAGRDIHIGATPARDPGLGSVSIPVGRVEHTVHGRDALIGELGSVIERGGQVVVLHAAGGYGKTTVAVAVAQRRQRRSNVWWVDATSSASVSEGLREVAVRAGAPLDMVRAAWAGDRSAPDLLWEALDSWAQPWLLVFDNADDPRVVLAADDRVASGRGWLRVPRHGTVLITSRDGRQGVWGRDAALYRVDALDEPEGAAVLRELSPESGSEIAARTLSRKLGGLPLALRLAGRYLAAARDIPRLPGSTQPRTFSEYTDALDNRFAEVTDAPVPGIELGSRELISRTWELSLDLLADRGQPLARPLLRLLATFAPAPIPCDLLNADVLAASQLFSEVTAQRLGVLLADLTGLGLVDYRPHAPGSVTLHPLVRQANRHQADAVDNGRDFRAAALAVLDAATMDLDSREPTTWVLWGMLLPHCVDGLTDAGDQKTSGNVWKRAGDFCDELGLSRNAETLYRRALAVYRREVGAEHHLTLSTRNNLALALRNLGDLDAAEAEFRDIVALRQRLLGPQHASTLTTRNNLAAVLRQRGNLDAAELEYGNVFAIRQSTLGDEHRDTLISRNNLAAVRRERGDLIAAEAEYRELLAIQLRTQPPDDVNVLTTRHNLAVVVWQSGQLDVAETEFREILSAQQRVLGDEHPHALTTQHNIGRVLHQRGDPAGARAEYQDVLSARLRVLGAEHPDTVLAQAHLAEVTAALQTSAD